MTYDIYAAPKLPGSLRRITTESELNFVLPLARRNHVINPSFEVDEVGETQPYNYESGTYNYATNTFSAITSLGAVTSENVYNGFQSMRINFSDTTTSLVYGRTQPITVPKSMISNQYVYGSKVYYHIKGALTFYTFVPSIEKYTPFSKFEQSGGSTHTIDAKVYATVDGTGYPNGSFSTQNIVSSKSIELTVPDATFFPEDVEPNVIGRRKNPFWVRHVVPFLVRYDEYIPCLIRFSITNNAAHSGSNFIFYLDAVQVEFFEDDFQVHTTYLDGDFGINDVLPSAGYLWDGAPRKSTSYRTNEAHSGGVLYNFQTDFDMSVLNTQGLGLPPQNNQITPFVSSDGQQYVGTGIDSRKISIDGYITGDTQLDTLRKTGQLQFFLSKARTGIGTKRRFYYRIPIGCDSYSDYTFFDAVVDQITVDHIHENPMINIGFELHNIDVYFWGDNYAYQLPNVLRPEKKMQNFEIVMFKVQGGNANSDYKTAIKPFKSKELNSFFGHNTYSLNTNGPVRCWYELASGQIMFGGDFTYLRYVINGKPTEFTCNHLALLNPDGTVIPIRDFNLKSNPLYNDYNGVTGPGATVYSIVQTKDESIMVGGRFNKALNRTYDCKNIWYIPKLLIDGNVAGENRDVEGGLTAINASKDKTSPTYVKTLLYDNVNDCIFVGGYFSRSSAKTNALRNLAIYNISKDYKWSAMRFGVNGIVDTMSFYEGKSFIVVGGDFTAAYYTSGTNLYTETKRAFVYDNRYNTAPAERVKSLTQVAKATSVVTLPTLTSVFDYRVRTSVTNSTGSVILGGNFYYIDYNNNALPTSFINRYPMPRVTQWDGFGRFTPMGTGVGSNDDLAIDFAGGQIGINDLCTCPYTNDIYAVGNFNQIGDLKQSIGIARWGKNRWEALDFEMEISAAHSVFVSKRGYGFASVSCRTTTAGNRNKYIEPAPIVIDNVGLNTQFSLVLTNPFTNYAVAKVLSIYNVTTDKSMSLNMDVAVGETITIDFTRSNVRATSNIRGRVSNSIFGGGTFANFYLAEGKNILKILGGQRASSANKNYAGRFVRPLKVKLKYHVRQVTPYMLFESDTIKVDESLVGWELSQSKLGLDTILIGNLQSDYPGYDWGTKGFRLDNADLGIDTVTIT